MTYRLVESAGYTGLHKREYGFQSEERGRCHRDKAIGNKYQVCCDRPPR